MALYISKNILGVDTDIDEMLGHIYLFLKEQLQLPTMPASGVLHGTLIGNFVSILGLFGIHSLTLLNES